MYDQTFALERVVGARLYCNLRETEGVTKFTQVASDDVISGYMSL